MDNMNIDWHLVDQMRKSLMQNCNYSMGRQQMYQSLIEAKMINKDGTPTQWAIDKGLVGYEPAKVEAVKVDTESLNRDVPYKKLLASVPLMLIDSIKKHPRAASKNKQAIKSMRIARKHLLQRSENEYNCLDWINAMFCSFYLYEVLRQNNLNGSDLKKLHRHSDHICYDFLKINNDTVDNVNLMHDVLNSAGDAAHE